jgi:hypothetical protein
MTTSVAPPELVPLPEPGAFRAVLDPEHTYFREHLVRNRRILPGVVSLALAIEGTAGCVAGARAFGVTDGAWLRPIPGDEPLDRFVLTFRTAADQTTVDYTVDNQGARCGMGTLRLTERDLTPAVTLAVRDKICANTRSHLTRREIYAEFSAMGIDYGAYFRRISYVQRYEQLSLAWLSNNDGIPLDLVNLLDCSFQAGMAISIGEHRDSLMPYSLGDLAFHALPRLPLASAFVLTEKHSPFRTSFTVYDEDYEPLISVFDLGVKPAI